VASKKITQRRSQQKAMHHEEIKLNFDALCQQILGLESEILWEAHRWRTPSLAACTPPRVFSLNLKVTIQEQQQEKTRLKILTVLTREHYTCLLHWV
jgi:hypothetical protein